MYINGGCNICDFSEPDYGYGPHKCSPEYCGKYTPTPIKDSVFEVIYRLVQVKTGRKMVFETIDEFNKYYKLVDRGR